MSALDFEEQAFRYLWRGLVLAGLLTVLWGALAPMPGAAAQEKARGAAATAKNRNNSSAAASASQAR